MQVLEIDNLNFGYTKDRLLFQNFSLTLQKGEIKAIVGESGRGKSTLFELILGNLKPISGAIKALSCSQVFQDPYTSFHPSYTIINQIRDVADMSLIGDVLKDVNIQKDLLHKYPHQLSGGQLQRASILRALLMQPQLLLLDEPTSALDNVIQLDVMKNLLNYLHKTGMLLITHDLELAKWCADDIVFL